MNCTKYRSDIPLLNLLVCSKRTKDSVCNLSQLVGHWTFPHAVFQAKTIHPHTHSPVSHQLQGCSQFENKSWIIREGRKLTRIKHHKDVSLNEKPVIKRMSVNVCLVLVTLPTLGPDVFNSLVEISTWMKGKLQSSEPHISFLPISTLSRHPNSPSPQLPFVC